VNGGVEVVVSGGAVVRLAATPPLAAKILDGPSGPILMLVGSAAGLLSGDTLRVRITLAPGSQLTVRTTAATIAHPCLGGGSTALDVECTLGSGARLAWLPEPLIACAGCHHVGSARVALGGGAVATWLDCLTLGRTGEAPGLLSQRLDVTYDGRPLLREGLRVGFAGWDGPAVLGPYRHVAALHLLGRRVAPGPSVAGVMQLAGPGTTARVLTVRGDELARQVADMLPFFLPTDPVVPLAVPCAKEAVHV
jgi:urease accessory protein